MKPDRIIHAAFAEDHILVREGIAALLDATEKIKVSIQADNGQELLNRIEAGDHLPDICIIDIKMPVMDGKELLREVRKRWPHMLSLVLTAYEEKQDMISMISLGANGCMLKNSNPDEIIEAICSICDTGHYYSKIANEELFRSVLDKTIRPIALTNSEIAFLKHLNSELPYTKIADLMHKSLRSVEGYSFRLNKKLHTRSKTGLLLAAIRLGIIDITTSNNSNRQP